MTKEYLQTTPGLSSSRRLNGTQPGIIDPTQPARLLRFPGAKLSFAEFDPLTASTQDRPELKNSRLNTELYRPKRVVIETAASGECTWRFVPSAKRENGLVDEGPWPRIVDLCGEFVEMTQDQWDIYKLDPLYECHIHGQPQITTIRGISQVTAPSPQLMGKRQLDSRSPSPRRAMPPPPIPPKKTTSVQSESEDEHEVEAMIINDEHRFLRHRSVTRESREELKNRRQARREKLDRKMELFSQDDEMYHNVYPNGGTFEQYNIPPSARITTPEPSKRKADCVLDTSWSPDSREVEELRLRLATNYIFTSNSKRTRVTSPNGSKRERQLRQKRMERTKTKQQKWLEEVEERRHERERRLLDEIMEEVPQALNPPENDVPIMVDTSMAPDDVCFRTDKTGYEEIDDAHREAIEESRRKLAELERDKPLWEERASERQFSEVAEQQPHKAKAEEGQREEARRKAEVEARTRKEREEAEAKKHEQEERAQRERDLREQERRQRQQRWSFGPWTTQRALERYRILSEGFDSTKFTSELPLTGEDVPWPSLQSPKDFLVEDVTWDSVERFFEAIRPHLRHQDFVVLVEQSHRRFHPDRWRSRNLLKAVDDEIIRGCMEVAANTVAQAITPIWRGLKGR